MTTKSFEIDWITGKETIEYDDDITYGELEAILQGAIDLSDVSKPKVNIPKYRFSILMKVLTKAPFPVGDAVSIRNLKSKQANQIMKEVMKDYPLAKYLGEWVESFTGSLNPNEQDSEFTMSAP
mgnify:FL=1